MPIIIKKPTGGRLVKGRDHYLQCTLAWDDGTHPDLTTSHFYMTIKASDADIDTDATIALNSIDNPDQFIVVDNEDGKLDIWIKKTDQDDIVPDSVKYELDVVVVISDGTEWPFVLDYNVVFCQPPTRETGHVV